MRHGVGCTTWQLGQLRVVGGGCGEVAGARGGWWYAVPIQSKWSGHHVSRFYLVEAEWFGVAVIASGRGSSCLVEVRMVVVVVVVVVRGGGGAVRRQRKVR